MLDTENPLTLLELARQEFAAVLVLKGAPDVSDRIFGFHAQQVVEHTLKAWLAHLGAQYPLTHSVNVLFAVLEDELGPEAVEPFRHLEILTPFAVQFQYSSHDGSGHDLDRDGIAIELRKLLDHVVLEKCDNES